MGLVIDISLTEFKTTVLNGLLDFLWRQWSAIGVAGQSTPEEPRVINPERYAHNLDKLVAAVPGTGNALAGVD